MCTLLQVIYRTANFISILFQRGVVNSEASLIKVLKYLEMPFFSASAETSEVCKAVGCREA